MRYLRHGAVMLLPLPGQYWYYCANPLGYYPYVVACGVEWQAVVSTIEFGAPIR